MWGLAEIKLGIVLLWALWISLVALMNLLEALKALRVLPPGWVFASENWSLLQRVTAVYRTPTWLTAALFGLAIGLQLAAGALLWLGFLAQSLAAATAGLGLCLALWAGFLLASQAFKAFALYPEIPAAHRSLFNTTLLSLMALRLL